MFLRQESDLGEAQPGRVEPSADDLDRRPVFEPGKLCQFLNQHPVDFLTIEKRATGEEGQRNAAVRASR